MVSVRAFAAEDLPAVLAVERASFSRDAWTAECFREYLRCYPEYFLVASVGNKVVGYSIACISRDAAELASIAVLPRFRRRSVGKLLLASTIARTLQAGVRQLWLMVRVDNVPAQRFYRSAGFRRKRRVPNYYQDGTSAWRLSLDLLR